MKRGMARAHVSTFRMDDQTVNDVAFVSRVQGTTPSEFVREAIARYLETTMASAEFRVRLAETIRDEQAILDKLS